MNDKQRCALQIRETDTEGVLRRLSGSVQVYELCLKGFLDDKTVEELNIAIDHASWDEAFTAAHALKGVAGNMGFYPLMHKTGQLIVLIRGGRTKEIPDALQELNSTYRDVLDGIHQYFAFADNKE